MDKYIQEGEQMLEGNQGQAQGQGQVQGQQAVQGGAQQGGSLGGGIMQAGEDGAINTGVNSLLTREGVPQGADGMIDAFVDKEANSFLGGNKNF